MNNENVGGREVSENFGVLPIAAQDDIENSGSESVVSEDSEMSSEEEGAKLKPIHHTINPGLDMKRFDLDDEDKSESPCQKTSGINELPLVFSEQEDQENKEKKDKSSDSTDDDSGNINEENDVPENDLVSKKLDKLFVDWEEKSARHESLEAFKNGYALPFLMELGYDIFNVDHVSPLDNGGGYIINNGSGRFFLSLNYKTLEDMKEGDIFLHITRDAFTIGTSTIEYISGRLKDLGSLYLIEHFKAANLNVRTLKDIEENYGHDQEMITAALVDIITSEDSPVIKLIADRLASNGNQQEALLRERIQIALSAIITKN